MKVLFGVTFWVLYKKHLQSFVLCFILYISFVFVWISLHLIVTCTRFCVHGAYNVLYSTHFTQHDIEFCLSVDEQHVHVRSVNSRDHGIPMFTVQLIEVLWLSGQGHLLPSVMILSQLSNNFPFDTHAIKPVKLATLLWNWQIPVILYMVITP